MTGFRVVSPVNKVFRDMKAKVRANTFAPEVARFLKRSLTTAIQITPARNASTIKAAQRKQYANRVNYIPSIHDLIDPTLIVKSDGSEWLYFGGKWYRPDEWKLSDLVWSVYQGLAEERARRLETDKDAFIAFRAQARFLYKKSWWEVGQSVGIDVACSSDIKASVSRRTDSQLQNGHAERPPRGYAQIRGGNIAYSIIVYNPFLEETSRYKPFSGKQILAQAESRHRAKFNSEVAAKQAKAILQALEGL